MQDNFDPIEVFTRNDGDLTRRFYAHMDSLGTTGKLATALFRAQKRSEAAKRYKGRSYTRAAYDVKNWSLSEVCRIAGLMPELSWGWKYDPRAINFENVLYVELTYGQCSFHSPDRLDGPDFSGKWKPQPDSRTSILSYCADVIIGKRLEFLGITAEDIAESRTAVQEEFPL